MNTEEKSAVVVNLEKTDPDTISKIRNLYIDTNNAITDLGNLAARKLDTELVLANITRDIKNVESNYTQLKADINELLKKLEEQYPDAVLDLEQGTISYMK